MPPGKGYRNVGGVTMPASAAEHFGVPEEQAVQAQKASLAEQFPQDQQRQQEGMDMYFDSFQNDPEAQFERKLIAAVPKTPGQTPEQLQEQQYLALSAHHYRNILNQIPNASPQQRQQALQEANSLARRQVQATAERGIPVSSQRLNAEAYSRMPPAPQEPSWQRAGVSSSPNYREYDYQESPAEPLRPSVPSQRSPKAAPRRPAERQNVTDYTFSNEEFQKYLDND